MVGEVTIASIVEGKGEIDAVPKLLHRIARQHNITGLFTPKSHMVPRSNLIRIGGVEEAVNQESVRFRRPGTGGGILVLLDADKDCPVRVAQDLHSRVLKACPGVPFAVVLPKPEFEAWFLAAAPSLSGQHGFLPDLKVPKEPEGRRDAKQQLSLLRRSGDPYKPKALQTKLASIFDLEMAHANSRSYQKFHKEVLQLLTSTKGT
jgi:hypothetical protein